MPRTHPQYYSLHGLSPLLFQQMCTMIQIKTVLFQVFPKLGIYLKVMKNHISLHDSLNTHLKTDQIACFGDSAFSKHAPRRLPPVIIYSSGVVNVTRAPNVYRNDHLPLTAVFLRSAEVVFQVRMVFFYGLKIPFFILR